MPLFLLAGGEIVLGLLALRVAVWVASGWREFRRAEGARRQPGGPDGGTVLAFPPPRLRAAPHRPKAAA